MPGRHGTHHYKVQRIGTDVLGVLFDDKSPKLGGNLNRNGFDFVGAGGLELLTFTETASAVNHINLVNAATGSAPIIEPAGDDASIPLRLRSKAGANIILTDGNNLEVLRLIMAAAAVNEVTLNNATTGNSPSAEATGGDTDIHFNIISKGTGVVQANGGPVARTDIVQAWTAAQYSDFSALTSGTNISIDLDDGPNFDVTLAHNATLDNPSNMNVGQTGIIAVTQDGTGTRTLAYGSYYKFVGGIVPILSTTAASEDSLHYFVRSATLIHVSSGLDWS